MTQRKELTHQEAIDFFSEFYGGEHHIPGYEVKANGPFCWTVNHNRGGLSTFDFNHLTRLVVMAHDKCIRVDLIPIRNGIMQISISNRKREGSIWERHPTIEEAIEKIRGL